MIKKLFESGYFKYQDFILENTKKLSLSPLEALVLIKMLDEFKNDKRIVIDEIANNLVEKRTNVEEAMSSLNEKGFYSVYVSYDNGLGEEVASLDGFFSRVEAVINNIDIVDKEDELYSIIEYLNGVLNRILTSQEVEIVTSLVKDDCYNLDNFKYAVEEKLKNRSVITIKIIARVLATKDKPKTVKAGNELMKDFIKNIK
jgi:DNA-binding MarR family transcriptional regulator